MLILFIFLIFIFSYSKCCKSYIPNAEIKKEYDNFIKKYNINYRTSQDTKFHFDQFRSKLIWNAAVGCILATQCTNGSNMTWKSGVTKFFDLSYTEFSTIHLRQIELHNLDKYDMFTKYNKSNSYFSQPAESYDIYSFDKEKFQIISEHMNEISWSRIGLMSKDLNELDNNIHLYSYTDENDIKEIIYNEGPVYIEVDINGMQYYTSGIFNPFTCPFKQKFYASDEIEGGSSPEQFRLTRVLN
jgi:hypothetical protein